MERRVRTDLFGDPWFVGLEANAKYLYLFLLTGQCLPNTQFIHMNYKQVAEKLSLDPKFVRDTFLSWQKSGIILRTENYVFAVKHHSLHRFTKRDNRTRAAKVELRDIAHEDQRTANLWRQQFFLWDRADDLDDYLEPPTALSPLSHTDLTLILPTDDDQQYHTDLTAISPDSQNEPVSKDNVDVTTTIPEYNINININKEIVSRRGGVGGNLSASSLFPENQNQSSNPRREVQSRRDYYNQLIGESVKQLPNACLSSWNNLVAEMKFKRTKTHFVEPSVIYNLLQDILASIEKWQWQPDEIAAGLRACASATSVAENERYFRKAAMSYRIKNARQTDGMMIGQPTQQVKQARHPDLKEEMDVWRR